MIKNFIILSIIFFILGSLLGVNLWIISEIPYIESVEYYEPLLTTRIYDRNGDLIDEVYQQRRIPVKLDLMPDYIANAAIAVEDKEFYNHRGINLRRILKVAWLNTLCNILTII